MKGCYGIFIFILIPFLHLFGQDSQTVDTLLISDSLHSPRKATIYSALLPGAGQVYNHLNMPIGSKKAFWKVPLIYAGLGATGYFLISNQLTQKSLKNEYTNRINGNPTDPEWQTYDNPGILTLYNQYLNRRDLSILGFAAVYLFQVLDANIEAHFVDFDVSEDLSLRLDPILTPTLSAGLSLKLNFH
jgi:hypothetical protein